jgi:hypothetical protein
LPFILVNTDKDTVIECEMTEDRRKVVFNFSGPFSVCEDKDIMSSMSLDRIDSWVSM